MNSGLPEAIIYITELEIMWLFSLLCFKYVLFILRTKIFRIMLIA